MMYRPSRVCAAIALTLFSAAATAQTPVRCAAIGDSLTDEYAEQTYGNIAKSWTQILVDTGRADFGPTAEQANVVYWGEPRRTGYRDNWARYSDTTEYGTNHGQHIGAAQSVTVHGAHYVVVFIGGNDFNRYIGQAYMNTYDGTWTQAQSFAYADEVVARIRTMVDALDGTGAKIVIASPLDFNFMGFLRNGLFNRESRERVTTMVARCRDGVRALAAQKQAVFLDMFRLNIDLYGGNFGFRDQVLVGNTPITMQQGGETGAFGFVTDGVHPQRVIQSIWAEAFLTAMNAGFEAGIPDISEQEMLQIGGLTYGGSDTLNTVLKPMRFYVQDFACPADFNVDRTVSVQDLFDFLNAFFTSDMKADINGSNTLSQQDLFDFLSGYFAGCA